MKAIIDLYPRLYLTAVGMHDALKEDAVAPVKADRERGKPMSSGPLRSLALALMRRGNPDAGPHIDWLGWLGRAL